MLPRDPIAMVTINTKPDEATKKTKQIQDVDQVADILEMEDQSRWVIYSQFGNLQNSGMGVHFAWNSIFENNTWTKMNLTKLLCGCTFCKKFHFWI